MHAQPAFGEDLFAGELIAGYLDGAPFVERRIMRRLEQAVVSGPAPIVLLEGEPGAGKTAVAAWLARRNRGWLRYFIRRDSRTRLRRADARSFLLAVGHQLATVRPELFEPAQLEIDVRQHVGMVAAGGRVSGVTVDDLWVSPFYRTSVRVRQHVGVVGGELEGLSVRRMVAEPRLLELPTLEQLALLGPARALQRQAPDEQVVIVVDALDEADEREQGETIVGWLARAPALPGNVRFLLSTRPADERLESLIRAWPALQRERIDPRARETSDELEQFLDGWLEDARMERALGAVGVAPAAFRRRVAQRAAGNFQYAAAVVRGITLAGESGADSEATRLVAQDELPASLGELYAFLLASVRDRVRGQIVERAGRGLFSAPEREPAWERLYLPTLGVLAVAREPLTLAQLAHFLAVETRWVRTAVGRLRHLLDEAAGGLRLYHATLVEFVTSDAERVAPFSYGEPRASHLAIARAYRGKAARWRDVDWTQVDDYGLQRVAYHVAGCLPEGEGIEELSGLLCPELMREQEARFGSHQPFAEDVAIVIAVAADRDAGLVDELRARWLRATLASRAAAAPLELVETLAAVGDVRRALGLAGLSPAGARVTAHAVVARGAARHAPAGEARAALAAALDAAETAPEGAAEVVGVLREVARELADARSLQRIAALDGGAAEASETEPKRDKERDLLAPQEASARRGLAAILGSVGERELAERVDPAGGDELPAVAELLAHLRAGARREEALGALAKVLAARRDGEGLHAAFGVARQLSDDGSGSEGWLLADYALAFAAVEDRQGIRSALDTALVLNDNTARAAALAGVGKAFAQAGDVDGVLETERAAARLHPFFVDSQALRAGLALALARSGQPESARTLASDLLRELERPAGPDLLPRVARDFARALIDIGRPERARPLLTIATPEAAESDGTGGAGFSLAPSFAPEAVVEGMDVAERAVWLAALAVDLVDAGERDAGVGVAHRALALGARAFALLETVRRVAPLACRALIRAGEVEAALAEIVEVSEGPGELWLVATELRLEAALELAAGRHATAVESQLDAVRRLLPRLPPATRDEVACDLVQSLARLGRTQEALVHAEAMDDAFLQVLGLREIVVALAASSQRPAAAPLAHRLAAVARGLDGPPVDRADALAAAALAFAVAEEPDAAERTIGEAVAAADEESNARMRVRALTWAGRAAALARREAAVERVVSHARALDPYARAAAAEPIVATLTEAARPEHLEPLMRWAREEPDPDVRLALVPALANGLAKIREPACGVRLYRELLSGSQELDRPELARVLSRGAPLLARIDDGGTLERTWIALREVEDWWAPAPAQP